MFRCKATTGLDDAVLALAKQLPSPRTDIDWAPSPPLRCLLEDVPHDDHAAFLRTGVRRAPDSDVFVRWRDGASEQWLEDIECCMTRPTPLAPGCTVFKGHPGRCDWQYVDPEDAAIQEAAARLTL
ncbi:MULTISPECIES: hypothetical protein [unclassified Streptomyces]|uniref:hypothetical protein n=1 Tax=unclassified Streptomyces TaxID=2593676 RepID=UPI000DB96712|nr:MULTISPECIES: hypothetical protein [unclassified Streptomyces]MYU06253.1 hypothetical protein [Streptomyces sp. SID8366]MYU64130.1 hypothetical protein [Streptomyces sp. SID69]RAJ53639.1 hypothetical protein K376_05599 [Streptomyces sp. PsTaAH-130]